MRINRKSTSFNKLVDNFRSLTKEKNKSKIARVKIRNGKGDGYVRFNNGKAC